MTVLWGEAQEQTYLQKLGMGMQPLTELLPVEQLLPVEKANSTMEATQTLGMDKCVPLKPLDILLQRQQ